MGLSDRLGCGSRCHWKDLVRFARQPDQWSVVLDRSDSPLLHPAAGQRSKQSQPWFEVDLTLGGRSSPSGRITIENMFDALLRYRSEFPILERTNYMISNSLGAMPRAVYDALHGYAD